MNKEDIRDLHELVDCLLGGYEERCEAKSSILEILVFADGVKFNLDEDIKSEIDRMYRKLDKLSERVGNLI